MVDEAGAIMAEFKINIDGKDFFVNGPEGATQAQAEAYARQTLVPQGTTLGSTPQFVPPGTQIPSEETRRTQAIRETAGATGYPEALAVGSGRTVDQLLSGGRQIMNLLSRDEGAKRRLAEEQKTNTNIYSGLQREMPFTTGLGETLPYMAVPPSAGVVGGAGIVGGLEALQYGSPQERLTRAVLGGGSALAGGIVGRGISGILQPGVPGFMNETRRAALEGARNIGYQPRLSEITGSPLASRIEDVSARIPGGAGVMQAQNLSNQRAINRAAATSIGEQSSEVGAPVLAQASDRLGKVFEDIKALDVVTVNGRQVKPIAIGQSVGMVADDILRQQSKMIPQQRDANLINLAQQAKIASTSKGRIDGETYQLTRSGLSEASYDASGTNRALYGKLLNALDDSAEQSLRQVGRGDLADALKTARPQYANLKLLERGVTAEGGNVSPARVASTMRTQNPSAFREGRTSGNPLYPIAQIGENLKPLQQGSQTFERQIMNPLTLAAYAPLSYMGAKATTNPLINWYAQQALMSPTMGALSAGALPVGRAGAMGLLGIPGGVFNPVASKY